MDLNFPVELESLSFTQKEIGPLSSPCLSRPHLQVEEEDFVLNVKNVATYRVQNGNKVSVFPCENADMESISLFLNGSVLGAVLHQQGIPSFHGSSFEYEGRGIIICGHSGTGKSSVTAAFCQKGGHFINDDITPVRVSTSGTTIISIKTRLKLWDDSLQKLKIESDRLEKIRPAINKFYLPVQESFSSEQKLNQIFVLSKRNKDVFEANELIGMAKYNILRNQIYRKSYLKGMPETGKSYFKQLIQLAGNVRVTQIFRPQVCDIYDTMKFIKSNFAR